MREGTHCLAGDPCRSEGLVPPIVSARLHAPVGAGRMPPLATRRIDEDGATLVDAWIRSLTGCP